MWSTAWLGYAISAQYCFCPYLPLMLYRPLEKVKRRESVLHRHTVCFAPSAYRSPSHQKCFQVCSDPLLLATEKTFQSKLKWKKKPWEKPCHTVSHTGQEWSTGGEDTKHQWTSPYIFLRDHSFPSVLYFSKIVFSSWRHPWLSPALPLIQTHLPGSQPAGWSRDPSPQAEF